jgi:acetyl esterase/lipase
MWLRPGDLRLTTCAGSSSTIHYATRATPFAQQLRDLGVEVQHVPHSGLVHGFLGLSHVSEAAAEAGRDLFDRFGDILRSRTAVSSH